MACILIQVLGFSQITLEYTYPKAASYGNSQLLMVNLEASGEKYVKIDRDMETIDVFNLDHTLYKSMSYAGHACPYFIFTPPDTTWCDKIIMYISEHLFDLDDEIEFMYIGSLVGMNHTRIINEDGTELFAADSAGPLVALTIPFTQLPIYNSTAGTKMILSHMDSTGRVYSLPGNLSSKIEDFNFRLGESQGSVNIYPNPTGRNFIVEGNYSLPAQLVIYDSTGKKIIEQEVTNRETIDSSELSKGVYYYIINSKTTKYSGKIVVN